MIQPPAWVRDYQHIPFAEGGRDRQGCDCWGLARLVWADRFGFVVPSLSGRYEHLQERDLLALLATEEQSAHWQLVPAAAALAGDCVLLRVMGRPIHVAVYLGHGQMLHTEAGRGVMVEACACRKWAHRLIGYYRWGAVR